MINMNPAQAEMLSENYIVNKITDFLKNKFIQCWKNNLNNDKRKDSDMKNKLSCYRSFKNDFHAEHYLYHCSNPIFRSNICRLRISCHSLHIETGRYINMGKRLKPEERICKYCNLNKVEDENHFFTRVYIV